jgi:hypothetical protein
VVIKCTQISVHWKGFELGTLRIEAEKHHTLNIVTESICPLILELNGAEIRNMWSVPSLPRDVVQCSATGVLPQVYRCAANFYKKNCTFARYSYKKAISCLS